MAKTGSIAILPLTIGLMGGCGSQGQARDLPKTFDCATVTGIVRFSPASVGFKTAWQAAQAQLPPSDEVASDPQNPSTSADEIEYFAYRDGELIASVRVVKLAREAGYRAAKSTRCTNS